MLSARTPFTYSVAADPFHVATTWLQALRLAVPPVSTAVVYHAVGQDYALQGATLYQRDAQSHRPGPWSVSLAGVRAFVLADRGQVADALLSSGQIVSSVHTDQVNTNLQDYLCKPSAEHLLGCNDLGYDQLGRLMVGGQTSLEVGMAAAK